jgi:hypothetical protein
MMPYKDTYRGSYRNREERIANEFNTIDDLLRKQKKGQQLNHYEKERLKKYAEENRKRNLANKKK